MTSDELYDGVTRRSVLRTGAVTAGAVTIGAAGAAANHDDSDHDNNGNGGNGNDGNGEGESDQKRGGRAQVEGDPQPNEPFTLSDSPTEATMSASCMSEESAPQVYLEYDIEYCNDDDDDNDDTMYVIPDEAELAQDEVYEFRSTQECKASDNTLVAFGPSNQDCE